MNPLNNNRNKGDIFREAWEKASEESRNKYMSLMSDYEKELKAKYLIKSDKFHKLSPVAMEKYKKKVAKGLRLLFTKQDELTKAILIPSAQENNAQ